MAAVFFFLAAQDLYTELRSCDEKLYKYETKNFSYFCDTLHVCRVYSFMLTSCLNKCPSSVDWFTIKHCVYCQSFVDNHPHAAPSMVAFYYIVYLSLLLSHGLNLIGQICSVICTNLLLHIILLPDPSLANSIHVQRWPTHALFLSDHDGRGNCYCLCSKIQPVSNPHTLCNLLKNSR